MNLRKLIVSAIIIWWLGFFTNSSTFAQAQAPCYNPPTWYTIIDTGFIIYPEWRTANCSCASEYKKVQKTHLFNSSDWQLTTNIAVCEKCDPITCNCGVKLNTSIPFIGSCLMYGNTNNQNENGDGTTTVNSINAFPILMGALIRLLVSVILLACFGALIVGWFMMTVPEQFKTGKGLVMKVVWTIVALWSLWLILYLINPNFFK